MREPTAKMFIRAQLGGLCIGGVCAVVVAAGCAETQPPAQTIEPPGSDSSKETATAAPARVSGPATAPEGGGNSKFVLSREAVNDEKPAEDPIHIGDKWWRFRGNFLKLNENQVHDRDAQVSNRQAPTDFWDPQTAIETVSIWTSLCNQCHGGRRRQQDAVAMPAPPANWGQGEGLFFGNRRLYSEVFATVSNGGPKREGKVAMPSWKNILAREQIWALLYFLEFQSGGIEGRFPPSLYPRMRTEVGQ